MTCVSGKTGMTPPPCERRRGQRVTGLRDVLRAVRGVSLVEVLVALTVFSGAVLALARAGFVASQALRQGGSYVTEWTVAQSKLDSLSSLGWAALDGEKGSESVGGVAVSWEVQGVNPRLVVVVVKRHVGVTVHPDTFMTYVADLD